jgi:protein TonB
MSLRCLLFSSDEEMVKPIWQVLAALEIEGEYCQSAVDAVEKVTTQSFQIVITDWDDQPEAAFLLKTARDLKAAQRPLTLAIVGEDARLPEALRAGANSVLLKPIRPEQVRDTMSTACQLLRSKQQTATQQPAVPPTPGATPEAVAFAAAASASPASLPTSVPQAPEKMRAGDFLQTSTPAPGAQFDTDSEVNTLEESGVPEVRALVELESTAALVKSSEEPQANPPAPLTGWSMLQARLTGPAAPKAIPSTKSELLSYGETPSHGATPAAVAEPDKLSAKKGPVQEAEPEAALFAYMAGEPAAEPELEQQVRPRRGKFFIAGFLALACVLFEAAHREPQVFRGFYRNAMASGRRWLNPPSAPLPQAVAQHDSFGQSGDEYKLPVPENIPDATTDPSQIQVLPVVDPTAKPDKNAAADPQVQEGPTDQEQSSPGQGTPAPIKASVEAPVELPVERRDPTTPSSASTPPVSAETAPAPERSLSQPNPAAAQAPVPQPSVSAPARMPAPPVAHRISASSNAGIPSSLKSQTASTTPESSGAKPVESAMSSIEPVNLPEAAVRALLTQSVDPEYPAGAATGRQRGSVVLQVLIGRDGAVQDAKFLQGSLVFARAAIDAVRQWHFKPYLMNGRAASVQSVITLTFKPPA